LHKECNSYQPPNKPSRGKRTKKKVRRAADIYDICMALKCVPSIQTQKILKYLDILDTV
jgi:hypothetical protein